jgi:hypothetical protein
MVLWQATLPKQTGAAIIASASVKSRHAGIITILVEKAAS